MIKNHHPNCRCSLCGSAKYDTFTFRRGYVCEQCLEYLKEEFRFGGSL